MSRRQLILLGMWSGAISGTAAAADATLAKVAGQASGDPFTDGPMLGNVSAHSIRIWMRTRLPMTWRVRYSKDASFSNAQVSTTVSTSWRDDAAGWVELAGLEPATVYFYPLLAQSGAVEQSDGLFHRFRTLPHANAFIHTELNPRGVFNFAFEVGSCNDQSWRTTRSNMPPTFATMRRRIMERIDFQIINGDFIYEDGRSLTARE